MCVCLRWRKSTTNRCIDECTLTIIPSSVPKVELNQFLVFETSWYVQALMPAGRLECHRPYGWKCFFRTATEEWVPSRWGSNWPHWSPGVWRMRSGQCRSPCITVSCMRQLHTQHKSALGHRNKCRPCVAMQRRFFKRRSWWHSCQKFLIRCVVVRQLVHETFP